MIGVFHLLDKSATWEQTGGAALLCKRLSTDRFRCDVVCTDPTPRDALRREGVDCFTASAPPGLSTLTAAILRRRIRRRRVDVIHTWGIDTLLLAMSIDRQFPIVVSVCDPNVSEKQAKAISVARNEPRVSFCCTSQNVQRRLVERGVPFDRSVVVRPGVDFARISAARKRGLRARLNLSHQDRVVIVPEPAERNGGHYAAYWGVAIRSFIEPETHIIIPGDSMEQRRIARIAAAVGRSHVIRCPGAGWAFQDLLAISDMLMNLAPGDTSSTAIAWAMAAGVPVLATAVYSTAELIANGHNGRLFKPAAPKQLAVKLAAAMDNRDQLARLTETARGQAYEVFGVRRCIDQQMRVYANLLEGRPVADGIEDSAAVA